MTINLFKNNGLWLVFSALISISSYAADNVHFTGTLVKQVCIIDNSDLNQEVNFSSISKKDLYLSTRTEGRNICIRLSNCDNSVLNTMKMTLSGNEVNGMPGYLDIASGGSGSASGIAVGFEDNSGTLIPINRTGDGQTFQSGDNVITFKTFITGKPESISNKNITEGPFTSTVTFSISYE